MPKKKEPSLRAKKYIKNKVAGMSNYQAAIKAGYSPNTAVGASKNIEKPIVKEALAELMDKKGLTDDKILDYLIAGLGANKIHGFDDNFVEIEDFAVRHKYLDLAVKLKKLISSDNNTNVQINNFIPLLGGDSSGIPKNNSNGEATQAQEEA